MSSARKILLWTVVSALALAWAGSVRAVVLAPIDATGTVPSYGSPLNLINGVGLLGSGPILGREHSTTYTQGWLINNTNAANQLTFAMPGAVDLSGAHIWQYSQGTCCTGRGVSSFDMHFSTDGGSTFPTTLTGLTLNAASGSSNETVQTLSFTPQTGVTHVKFDNMVDFPALSSPGWQGLNEVRFEGDAPDFLVEYIGDFAIAGKLVSDLGSSDSASGGSLTYAFPDQAYTNESGRGEFVKISEVNFWADGAGTLTPFVALYDGGDVTAASSFEVIVTGDSIAAVAGGVNNAAFTVGGENPIITLGDGDTLVAGFYQSGRIVPFSGSGSFDYLRQGNSIPSSLPGNLTADASYTPGFARTYSFNVGLQVVTPEPTTLLIWSLLAGLGVGLGWRRRR